MADNSNQENTTAGLTENDIFVVGYDGWVKIKMHKPTDDYFDAGDKKSDIDIMKYVKDGIMLQVVSASISRNTNIPTVNSYYLPFKSTDDDDTTTKENYDAEKVKSQIRLGKGTYSFSGEISFELTLGTLKEFFNEDFFTRCAMFSVMFFDGQKTCIVTNCVWSSLQIQCSPASIVTVSLSYQSNNGYSDDLMIYSEDKYNDITYNEQDLLVPYWQCGHNHFQDFSISFERNVTPVFLNGNLNVASYIRPGLITMNLSATTVEYISEWENEITIQLGIDNTSKYFDYTSTYNVVLSKPVLQSMQYNMSTMSDTGSKTYSWSSISVNASDRVFYLQQVNNYDKWR